MPLKQWYRSRKAPGPLIKNLIRPHVSLPSAKLRPFQVGFTAIHKCTAEKTFFSGAIQCVCYRVFPTVDDGGTAFGTQTNTLTGPFEMYTWGTKNSHCANAMPVAAGRTSRHLVTWKAVWTNGLGSLRLPAACKSQSQCLRFLLSYFLLSYYCFLIISQYLVFDQSCSKGLLLISLVCSKSDTWSVTDSQMGFIIEST